MISFPYSWNAKPSDYDGHDKYSSNVIEVDKWLARQWNHRFLFDSRSKNMIICCCENIKRGSHVEIFKMRKTCSFSTPRFFFRILQLGCRFENMYTYSPRDMANCRWRSCWIPHSKEIIDLVHLANPKYCETKIPKFKFLVIFRTMGILIVVLAVCPSLHLILPKYVHILEIGKFSDMFQISLNWTEILLLNCMSQNFKRG